MLWGMSQVLPEAGWDWTNQHAETKLYLIITDIFGLSYCSSIPCYLPSGHLPHVQWICLLTVTRTWLLYRLVQCSKNMSFVRCEVLTVVVMKIQVFWNAMPCWEVVTTVSKGHNVFEMLLTWSLVTIIHWHFHPKSTTSIFLHPFYKQTFCMTFHSFLPLATIC